MWPSDDACIKCSICVSACPIYVEDPAFPGPKVLGPDWFRQRQSGIEASHAHASDCTFCQLCEASCPVGVPIAHLIALHKGQTRQSPRRWLRDYFLVRPHWMAKMPQITRLPKGLGKLGGISPNVTWPTSSKADDLIPLQDFPRVEARGRVALFIDCFARGFDQHTIAAARMLIEAWGYGVKELPIQSRCCGAAAQASGRLDDFKRFAVQSYLSLTPLAEDIEAIVTLNATCDATLREEWPKYLDLNLPVPIVSFTEFALAAAPDTFWERLSSRAHSGDATWVHATCRSRGSRGDGSLMRLAHLSGLNEVAALGIECCGAAGSYAFKVEHEETASQMGKRAAEEICGQSGRILVDSGTCALHLQEASGLQAKHPAYWIYQQFVSAGREEGRSEVP